MDPRVALAAVVLAGLVGLVSSNFVLGRWKRKFDARLQAARDALRVVVDDDGVRSSGAAVPWSEAMFVDRLRTGDVVVASPDATLMVLHDDPRLGDVLARLRKLEGWDEAAWRRAGTPGASRRAWTRPGPQPTLEEVLDRLTRAPSAEDLAEMQAASARAPGRDPFEGRCTVDCGNDGIERRMGDDVDGQRWEDVEAVVIVHDPRDAPSIRTRLCFVARRGHDCLVVPSGAARFDALLHETARRLDGLDEEGLRRLVAAPPLGTTAAWSRSPGPADAAGLPSAP